MSLKTEEEIKEFIKERIEYLEANSKEAIVGQGYTDSFQDFISSKVHFKAVEKFGNMTAPDLVFDDDSPYEILIKMVQDNGTRNPIVWLNNIFYAINNYFKNNSANVFSRFEVYFANSENEQVSIKEIKDNHCAFCSEKSGLAHNMLRFLGFASEFVCGYRNNEPHAYTLMYPKGYDGDVGVIFDPSFFVSFVGKYKYDFAYFVTLKGEILEKFKKGEAYSPDLTNTEKNYYDIYGFSGALDGYTFKVEPSEYIWGLEKEEKLKK